MNDDYHTCSETYVTLRVYHDSADPDTVSAALGIEPTESQRAGEPYEWRGRTRTYRLSGWFFCSRGRVESYDSAKHLDWLLQYLEPRHEALCVLRSQGWRMDISCLWDSHYGHGGPTLSPDLLRMLATVGIELWFDIYFHGAYDAIKECKRADAIPPRA